jgi:hypothetical protein
MPAWTAAALTSHTTPAQITDAHRRAAAYWRWRVDVWPQDRATDIQQLLHARNHHPTGSSSPLNSWKRRLVGTYS